MTNDPKRREPPRSDAPRNDVTALILPTRAVGTPFFHGWGPKLL
jgi:hypothetical protein